MSWVIWLIIIAWVIKNIADFSIAHKCKKDGDDIFWKAVNNSQLEKEENNASDKFTDEE